MKKTLNLLILILVIAVMAGVVFFFNNRSKEKLTNGPEDETMEEILDEESEESIELEKEIGGGGLYLDPLDSPLAPLPDINSWATYTKNVCGFEIKLPRTYAIHVDIDCDEFQPGHGTGVLRATNLRTCTFPFSEVAGCQLHDFLVQENAITHEGEGVIHENIDVNGIQGEKITSADSAATKQGNIHVQVEYNGQWYHYDYYFHVEDYEVSQEVFEMIISTFRFL